MQKTIELQPEKITELAQKINDTISSLTNIDAIIRDTENDLNQAKSAKHLALETKLVSLTLYLTVSQFYFLF